MKAVTVHKRVKLALAKLHGEFPNHLGFYIVTIGKEAKTDTRTAKNHCEILEVNGLGNFLDPDKKVFGLKGVLTEEKR